MRLCLTRIRKSSSVLTGIQMVTLTNDIIPASDLIQDLKRYYSDSVIQVINNRGNGKNGYVPAVVLNWR
jgi:hypothetical protein